MSVTTLTTVRRITSKRQLTIPPKAMQVLGSDQVLFEVKDGQVILRPTEMSLEEAFGSVPTPDHLQTKSEKDIEELLAAETANKYQTNMAS